MNYHYFIGQKGKLYHLSVGAVLVDGSKKVLCHHVFKAGGKMDIYVLMRKTLKPNETLEKSVKRGLMEEFGARAKVIRYIGSIESSFKNWQGVMVRKTTLYFLCRIIGSPKKVKHIELDDSKGNVAEWRSVKFLIPQMKKQARLLKRNDFDESEILKRI